jgi:hypothetical protein
MKNCPVRAELLHVDGRTDMAKLTVVFRNFANMPNDEIKKRDVGGHEIATLTARQSSVMSS